MPERHEIMSTDIIPRRFDVRLQADSFRGKPCAFAGGMMPERHEIMSTDIIPRRFDVRLQADSFRGKPCAFAGGMMPEQAEGKVNGSFLRGTEEAGRLERKQGRALCMK